MTHPATTTAADSTPVTPGTPIRYIRIGDDDWEALDTASQSIGGRSTALRRLISLYLRDPALARRVEATADPVLLDHCLGTAVRMGQRPYRNPTHPR